jgi:hypothetical protein
MLVRQSDLLVTNSDLVQLEAKLRDRGDVLFLSAVADNKNEALLPLDTLAIQRSEKASISLACFLAPVGRPPGVKLEVMSPVKTSVNLDQSELIELSRSYVTDAEIGYGNLRYLPRFSGLDGVLHDKDPVFVDWAKGVFQTIKRALTFDKRLDAYLGADAGVKIETGVLRIRPRGW